MAGGAECFADRGGDVAFLTRHVDPREMKHAPAERREQRIAPDLVLELLLHGVLVPPVHLCSHAEVWPRGIKHVPVDLEVKSCWWQPAPHEQVAEPHLEHTVWHFIAE